MKYNILLTIVDSLNNIGEIDCFLRRSVLQSDNSLLTGTESGFYLKDSWYWELFVLKEWKIFDLFSQVARQYKLEWR